MAAGNTQGSAKPAAVQFPQEKEAVAWSAESLGGIGNTPSLCLELLLWLL